MSGQKKLKPLQLGGALVFFFFFCDFFLGLFALFSLNLPKKYPKIWVNLTASPMWNMALAKADFMDIALWFAAEPSSVQKPNWWLCEKNLSKRVAFKFQTFFFLQRCFYMITMIYDRHCICYQGGASNQW